MPNFEKNDIAAPAVHTAGGFLLGEAKDSLETIQNSIGLDTPSTLPPDYNLGQSKYDFKSRVFPADLGSGSYNGHYMIININVSNYTNFGSVSGPGGVQQNFAKLGDLSKVDALRGTIDQQYRGNGKQLGPGQTFVPRQTRRIAESIALFMPNTVVFSGVNQYEDVSLTGLIKDAVYAFGGKLVGTAGRIAETAAGLAQAPINPRVEVLFSNTAQRQFQYDFLFAPVNPKESADLRQIIQTLRFHGSPEVNPLNFDSLKGLLWTPPSEFDITFYNKGKENTNLPRINTCVLEQIDVDYAPSGVYATFSDGFPVKVRMQLRFREVEVNHKLRVLQGF